MAEVHIPILRQNYKLAGETDDQYNGFEPNVIATEPTGGDVAYITKNDTVTIEADFKDHKTVFVIKNADSAAKTVTFKAGNSYAGVKDLSVSAAVGTNYIWLDSAPFVNKATGVITVTTDEATASKLSMYGYEMR